MKLANSIVFGIVRQMVTTRMQKFDELILREVSLEVQKRFPSEIISITQVHVSKDLSFAKVWLSAVQNIDNTVKEAQKQSSEIRKALAKKIIARRVPNIHFVADKTEEHAQKIENLLSEIKDSDKS